MFGERLEHFPAKWVPVRISLAMFRNSDIDEKVRQIKKLEPFPDSMEAGKALERREHGEALVGSIACDAPARVLPATIVKPLHFGHIDESPFGSNRSGIGGRLAMSVESSILFIAEPSPQHQAAVEALRRGFDYRVMIAAREADATDVLNDAHIDLVLADVDNRCCDIVAYLARLRFTHPDLVRVLIVADDA
ncbi:MAG TPA: hypothetical protein VME69_11100, partial [Methylocella sp.]|nr:hypothetical protein [Methylocella sp.]